VAKRSSTSSSRAALPWGPIGAVLLLGAFEAGLRVVRPEGHVMYSSGLQASRLLPLELAENGSADVVVLGSSRALQGVSVPHLRGRLEAAGAELRVANYALTGARAEEVNLVAHTMLRHRPRPALVLYSVEPRGLLPRVRGSSGVRAGLRLRDWVRLRRRGGAPNGDYFGAAVRNSLTDRLWLFRYAHVFEATRDRAAGHRWSYFVKRMTVLTRRDTAPMLGGPSIWHDESPLHSANLSRKRASSYLKRVTEGEPYRLAELQLAHMHDTVGALRAAGVDVVLYEQPPSRGLRAALPKDVLPAFQEQMRALAAEHDVRYVDADELDLGLISKDWREHSHLNLRGATKATNALADLVVLPWVEAR